MPAPQPLNAVVTSVRNDGKVWRLYGFAWRFGCPWLAVFNFDADVLMGLSLLLSATNTILWRAFVDS